MAGYTRQSAAEIVANAVIKAAPLNAELNALRDTFAFATGHKHDGSSTEGAFIPTIADVDALNKVVIDSTNNRIGFFSQVGSGTVEQLRIQDGAIVPVTDSDIDLGAAGAEFKNLHIDGIGYIDTLAVHENATIAGTLGVTGLTSVTTLTSSGRITGNNFLGPLAGNVTGNLAGNVTSSGNSVLATVDINGGTIDGTQIGASATSTINGTTITGANFVGPLAGAVTGNLSGNTAGVHTGAVTGNVTGNIASTGSSSFTDLTINGSLNMNAGTSGTITGLSNPVQGTDAATKTYVDAKVAAVLDSAPAALDTLNELAAALGDDANYASTTTAAIATKLPKAGGTMTGAIAMGTNKVTGLGTPTAGTDAAHKTYVDGVDALKLNKAGDTMSGVLAMGANKITGVANPTAAQDVVTKAYSDTLFGSTAAAATSAANAATSESNAAADLALTNADVVLTNADVVSTNADVVSTNADVTASANSASAAATSASNAASAAATAANAIVDGAPANLNTLNEIAASINDDADFVGTMNTALAAKASTSSVTTSINNLSTVYDPIGASVAMAIALGG